MFGIEPGASQAPIVAGVSGLRLLLLRLLLLWQCSVSDNFTSTRMTHIQ